MLSLKIYLKNPRILLSSLLREYGGWIPDKPYLQMMYYLKMGKWLNLDGPQTFSEKLQWLKLYNRKPEYSTMVDKLQVKDYVADIIGSDYIIPTLGVWDNPENIDFDSLPNQFVLKTTHGGGGGGVVICRNKTYFDKNAAVNKLRISMKQSIYKTLREWPYKNVKPRVLAEKYIEDSTLDLIDYKFYCFHGKPLFCQVITNRSTKETIDFFDMRWQHQKFYGLNPVFGPKFCRADIIPSKPIYLDTMRGIATRLSQGIIFCRIDMYEVQEKIHFGEMTFFPASGFGVFAPSQYNKIIGDLIELPLS